MFYIFEMHYSIDVLRVNGCKYSESHLPKDKILFRLQTPWSLHAKMFYVRENVVSSEVTVEHNLPAN